MESNNLFYNVISCAPILKKILSYLSIEDCYDFSRTCKTTFIRLKEINMYRTMNTKWKNRYHTKVRVNSLTDIKFSMIKENRHSLGNIHTDNPKIIEKLFMLVNIADGILSEIQVVKKIGKKINKYLKSLPNVQELFLYVNKYSLGRCLVQDFMKEIINDKITVLTYKYIFYRGESVENVPLINDVEILRGFSNLKRFVHKNIDPMFCNVDEHLLNIISQKEGLTLDIETDKTFDYIEIDHHNSIIFNDDSGQISLNVSSVIDIDFIFLVQNPNTLRLSIIRSLNLFIQYFETFPFICKHFKYMTNLESLSIELEVQKRLFFNINLYPKEFKNTLSFEPFKNLMKLKSMVIEGNYCIERNWPEIEKEVFRDFFKSCKFISRKITSFLRCAPPFVEKLYLRKLPELTNKMTTIINKSFPNLILLHLETIDKVNRNCLMKFNNLQICEFRYMDILKIPRTVNICVISEDEYSDANENFNNYSKYIKDLERYNKEVIITKSPLRKVFFNDFLDYLNFKYHAIL